MPSFTSLLIHTATIQAKTLALAGFEQVASWQTRSVVPCRHDYERAARVNSGGVGVARENTDNDIFFFDPDTVINEGDRIIQDGKTYDVLTVSKMYSSQMRASWRKWSQFSDGFEGPELNPQWVVTSFPGTAPIVVDGQLHITTEEANPEYSSNGIYSTLLDLLNSSASVEIVDLGPMLTGDDGYIAWPIYAVSQDNALNLQFNLFYDGEKVRFAAGYWYDNGVDTPEGDETAIEWDPAIKYVRIRNDGMKTYWEYSTDGDTWTVLLEVDTSAWNQSAASMVVGPFADQLQTSTGTRTVVYDNWNGGTRNQPLVNMEPVIHHLEVIARQTTKD